MNEEWVKHTLVLHEFFYPWNCFSQRKGTKALICMFVHNAELAAYSKYMMWQYCNCLTYLLNKVFPGVSCHGVYHLQGLRESLGAVWKHRALFRNGNWSSHGRGFALRERSTPSGTCTVSIYLCIIPSPLLYKTTAVMWVTSAKLKGER